MASQRCRPLLAGSLFLTGFAMATGPRIMPKTPLGAQPAQLFAQPQSRRVLSLAGDWKFSRGTSASSSVPPSMEAGETLKLPGTTDTNRIGPPSQDRPLDSLAQPYNYQGLAWYQRRFSVPAEWSGKFLQLTLERTKFTRVFIDGKPFGQSPIICSAQNYELGNQITPGEHVLTIAVDNSILPPHGADAHQVSGNTQGNWNGILGRIEMSAHDAASIADVQLYPNAADHTVTVHMEARNSSEEPMTATLKLTATGLGVAQGASLEVPVTLKPGFTNLSQTLALGDRAALWDEFEPNLHSLTATLHATGSEDVRTLSFGLRDFKTDAHHFLINGQATFLRGKHDACVFPLTGHPPMDVEGWRRYFEILKSYGLNHVRFHTWTPPDAAFTAADQMGFYLQPELPFWGSFDQTVKDALFPEAEQILKQYGNHPSFVMFSTGNEHWGVETVLNDLVAQLRKMDSRHLYIRGTNAISWMGRPGPNDDYLVSSEVKSTAGVSFPIRGSNSGKDVTHVQIGPANTMLDYEQATAQVDKPVIAHEIGQYTVYPDFSDIAKYTGVTKPTNLEAFRDKLAAAGMLDQATIFAKASGALAALCYREDIEAMLRTPDFGGFEMLDLQDFPGQGTALVGLLDAFMDSKNIVTPEKWRQFCSPVVLLAKFEKYAWTSDESLKADILVSQYGPKDLHPSSMTWQLRTHSGLTVSSGSIPGSALLRGGVRKVGEIEVSFAPFTQPTQLELDLSLEGTGVTTSYPLWVYPPVAPQPAGQDVMVAQKLDKEVLAALNSGKRVLLVCDGQQPLARTVGGGFATDFWNFRFFHNKPGTMGLLCDPTDPALDDFPTESHSNWNWFAIALHSQPLVLDGLFPKDFKPSVQVIDNQDRCHKLGLIFEATVGTGKLLVCATDLISLSKDHPEAAQLLACLKRYASAPKFTPRNALSPEALSDLLRTTVSLQHAKVTASSFDGSWKGYKPEQVIDGNESRGWLADAQDKGPQWIEIELASPVDFSGFEILWDEGQTANGYRVLGSYDGTTWTTLANSSSTSFHTTRHRWRSTGKGLKKLRVEITSVIGNVPPAIQEVRLFPSEAP